jgi:hypothetical protein
MSRWIAMGAVVSFSVTILVLSIWPRHPEPVAPKVPDAALMQVSPQLPHVLAIPDGGLR